jgi:hypothetical protein
MVSELLTPGDTVSKIGKTRFHLVAVRAEGPSKSNLKWYVVHGCSSFGTLKWDTAVHD